LSTSVGKVYEVRGASVNFVHYPLLFECGLIEEAVGEKAVREVGEFFPIPEEHRSVIGAELPLSLEEKVTGVHVSGHVSVSSEIGPQEKAQDLELTANQTLSVSVHNFGHSHSACNLDISRNRMPFGEIRVREFFVSRIYARKANRAWI
jgi:hypothetical protein